MMSAAHILWNRQWFNREDINSGGVGMGAYGNGMCFE